MPRRHPAETGLPPLPAREKREIQARIRLTPSEVGTLTALRPDLSAPGIVASSSMMCRRAGTARALRHTARNPERAFRLLTDAGNGK